MAEAGKAWNKFYDKNENKFFKDRHYIAREFEEMTCFMENAKEEPVLLFEVGCGVGNTFFPLMKWFPLLHVYAVDFSKNAIDCIIAQERFNAQKCNVWVCDIVKEPLPLIVPHLQAPMPQVHLITLIFVLSAIPHEHHQSVVEKIYQLTLPGGAVFLRDYARFDMTQMRFKSGLKLNDDLYCRSDGTLTAYFTREQTKTLFESAGFILKENLYHRKTIINRKNGIKMNRIWIQVRAYKPKDDADRQYWNENADDIARAEEKKIKDAQLHLMEKSLQIEENEFDEVNDSNGFCIENDEIKND